MIPVSIVVYWMMIFWLKQSDTCGNGDLPHFNILKDSATLLEHRRVAWTPIL